MFASEGTTEDPNSCYVTETIAADGSTRPIALPYSTEANQDDWAGYFRAWYIAGVVLGVANIVVVLFDGITKCTNDGKGHCVFAFCGLVLFFIAFGHFIWICIVRFSESGMIVSGDYREPEDPRKDYLEAHGLFALIYIYVTLAVLGISILGCCCCGCYLACIFKGAERAGGD